MNLTTRSYIGCITQWFTACVGIYLMFASAVWGYGRPAAAVDWVVGPLVASFAIIAAWEVTRNVRWLNLAGAATLLVAPLIADYPAAALGNSVVVGVLLIGLTLVPYPHTQHFGGGWISLGGQGNH